MKARQKEDIQVIGKDFQRAATTFFGVPVRIEERALKAVCVSTGSKRQHPRPLHIWSQVEKEIPAVQQFYELLSLVPPQPNRMGFPNVDRNVINDGTYIADNFDWEETLHSIFANPSSEHFTQAGSRIRKSRVLSVRDLVSGLLEFTYQQIKSSETPFINLKRTLLGQLLHRAPLFPQTDHRLEKFSIHAVEQWDKVCGLDPFLGNEQFVVLDGPNGFRVLPFAVLGGYKIIESEGSPIWQARGNVLQPIEDDIGEQIKKLESLINGGGAEREFQRFFERFPRFLTNIGPYQKVHAQLVLHREQEGSLIPDFFLEKIDSDFCDICDLKLPTHEIVRHQKNRTRFRDAIMEGIAQLTYYRDWFDSPNNRNAFTAKYGINSYRPRAVLVIGRRASFSTEIERLQLEGGLPNWFQLLTYDEIINRAKHWRNVSQNIA